MTEQQYQCPICDYSSGSKGSVKAHITRKTDENHAGKSGPNFSDQITVGEVSDNSDESTETANTEPTEQAAVSSDGGVVPDGHRAPSGDRDGGADDGPDCCSSPELRGSSGDVFELTDGRYVRLEAGDRICVNCDEVHE